MEFPLLTESAQGLPLSKVWVQFDVTPATTRQGLTTIKLHAGVVDEMAVEFFCFGGCCVLAAAMHELSGWPLMAYYRANPKGGLDMMHLGVMTPGEEFLDVQGIRSYTDLREVYGEGWRSILTLEYAVEKGMIREDGWRSGFTVEHTKEIVLYFAAQSIAQAVKAESLPQGGTPA